MQNYYKLPTRAVTRDGSNLHKFQIEQSKYMQRKFSEDIKKYFCANRFEHQEYVT